MRTRSGIAQADGKTKLEKIRFARIDDERITLKAGETKKRKKHIGKMVYPPQDIEALKAVWDFSGSLVARSPRPF